jgi:competence protein ComEC
MTKSPALLTLVFFGSGIFLNRFIFIPLLFLMPAIAVLILSAYLLKESKLFNALIIGSLILSGILYHTSRTSLLPPHHISRIADLGAEVALRGRIITDPVHLPQLPARFSQPHPRAGLTKQDPLPKGETLVLICKGESLFVNSKSFPITGKIRITVLQPEYQYRYGDLILVEGKLTNPKGLRNPGGFDFRSYLARQGIFSLMKVEGNSIQILKRNQGNPILLSIILPTKRYMERIYEKILSGETLNLLLGITLGEREAISDRVKRAFSDTGTIHVLAISGLHVGIIGFILFALLRTLQIPFNLALIMTNIVLLGYAYLTGLHPPVIRATIMSLSVSIGLLLEREIDLINVLAIAGLLLLLLSPTSLFDVGAQLSFAATFSIIFFVNRFQILLPVLGKRSIIGRWFLLPLGVSISAQLGVAPILAYHFHIISVLSILANVILIPLVGVAIALGLSSVFASLISLSLAQIFGSANWLVLSAILRIVEFLNNIHFSSFRIPSPPVILILFFYAFIFLIVQWKESLVSRKLVIYLILISLNLFVWHKAFNKSRMEVTFLDVGQGDATLIKFLNGRTLLIDGGDRYERFDAGERVVAPFLWRKGIRKIDVLLLTHPHKDHIGGFSYIIDHFKVGIFIDSGIPYPSNDYLNILKKLQKKGITYEKVVEGDRIQGFGVPITVLHPGRDIVWFGERDRDFNPNDGSVVIQFQESKISFLFPGDIQEEAPDLIERGKEMTVVKVPHHGSKASNPSSFVSHFSPEISVFSCGFNNQFGFPEREVLEKYRKEGSTIYRTDLNGAVILQTDGEKVEVFTMENGHTREQIH